MRPNDLSDFRIRRQPDDTTCGPTCLHAVYRHFGDEVSLAELLRQVPALDGGGTLGVLLAEHALARGYHATIFTWNLRVFDPTWFDHEPAELRERLLARARAVGEGKLGLACQAYARFIEDGGLIEMRDLGADLLGDLLDRGLPVLTGLSASFLYREARERGADGVADDVAGEPVGHFVVLTGCDAAREEVLVSDPMHPDPLAQGRTYPVSMQRILGAIYLGVLTHDGNMLVIEPAPPGESR